MNKKSKSSTKVKDQKKSGKGLFKKGTLYLYLTILIISFFSTYPKTYEEKIFLGGDNAAYYLLGKSLAEGKGYVNAHIVNGGPANHFPPGYSFVIGQVLKITSGDIQTIKHLNGFFFLGVLILIFLIARRFSRNDHLAFATSFFVLFNMHFLMYSSIVMSEMSFSFFSFLALFAFISRKDDVAFYKSIWFYVLVASIILAVYIRTQGVVFVGLWLVWGIMKKQYSSMTVGLGIVILALLPWQMRSADLGGGGYQGQIKMVNPYDKSLGTIDVASYFTRVGNNAKRYLGKEIPNSIFPRYYVKYVKDPATGEVPQPGWIGYGFGLLLAVMIVLGAWSIKKWRWFILLYLGGNLLIFLSWPDVWFGIRFMFAVIPLLCFLLFTVVFKLGDILYQKLNKKSLPSYFALVFLLLAIVHSDPYKKYEQKVSNNYPLKWRNYMDLSSWAKRGLADSSIIACRKPHLFAIQSNKTVSTFPYTAELDTVLAGLIDRGVTHVVVESIGFTATYQYLYPTVMRYKDKFKLLHKVDPEEAFRRQNPAAYKGKASTGAFIFEFNPEVGYFGSFDENNKRVGKGVFIKSDGTRFDGTWENGLLEGNATVKASNGDVYVGPYTNGKRNGEFEYTKANGETSIIVFENDKVVNRQ